MGHFHASQPQCRSSSLETTGFYTRCVVLFLFSLSRPIWIIQFWTHALYTYSSGNLTLNKPHPSENPHFCPIFLLCFLIKFVYLAWPGMRECVPRYKGGIWCCRFYTVLVDGSGFGDICWPLAAIERINQNGQAPWQQFMNPLLPGP